MSYINIQEVLNPKFFIESKKFVCQIQNLHRGWFHICYSAAKFTTHFHIYIHATQKFVIDAVNFGSGFHLMYP